MSKKISLSIFALQGKYGNKRAIEIAKKAGFDGVDFNLDVKACELIPDVMKMSHEEFVAYFTELRQYADKLGIKIAQTHGLCDAYCPDKEYNEILKRKTLLDLEATALLGCKYCVIHCVSTFKWGFETPYEKMHEINQKMYSDFISTAEKFGVNIALESFGGVRVRGVDGYDCFADPERMMKEFEDIKTENKVFCFDSGHTHVASSYGFLSPEEYIKYFGNRIKLLHLHDNDKKGDQHTFPGQGIVNWKNVFSALESINYDGYYNYELRIPFGEFTEQATMFLGKYLREFTEKNGNI